MAELEITLNYDQVEEHIGADVDSALRLMQRVLAEGDLTGRVSYLRSIGFTGQDAQAIATLVRIYTEPDHHFAVYFDRDVRVRGYRFIFSFREASRIVFEEMVDGMRRTRRVLPSEYTAITGRSFDPQSYPHDRINIPIMDPIPPPQIATKPDPPKEPPKRRLRF